MKVLIFCEIWVLKWFEHRLRKGEPDKGLDLNAWPNAGLDQLSNVLILISQL
jgi:hypothetical protein